MPRKPKTIEVTLRVRVPADWSPAHAKRELSHAWYGEVYAIGPDGWAQVSLFPHWRKARVIKPGAA